MQEYEIMQLIEPKQFWRRIDDILYQRDENLKTLCEKTEISYNTLGTQRARCSIPKPEQLLSMAQALGVSMEYLLTGHGKPPICEEAQAVQNDSDLQALVRSIQRDRSLLSTVAAFIRSYENENIR